MGDGECTMDPGCGPNFVLLQGQKDAEKLRNKGQKFWCTLGRGGGWLQRKTGCRSCFPAGSADTSTLLSWSDVVTVVTESNHVSSGT